MVPWLVNRQGIDLQQAADDLGVSVEQLEADLNLLFLCGYGQLPDELIEADWEEGRVFVGNADTIARPLRLGVDEAVTLVVGLRALREVPGLGDRDAVERALAKLEDAAGAAAAPARRVRAEVADGASPELLALAQQAIADHRRVHLRYLVPARDEATERDVDPMRVVGMDGSWYLEGWCHRAEDTRMFRMDRVEELIVLDVDGTPPAGARERDLSEGTFRPAPDDLVVTLRLLPGATWVADYYPVESAQDVPAAEGGGLLVRMRTADTAWLRRLVWRLGGRGTVLDPPEVVAEVRDGCWCRPGGLRGIRERGLTPCCRGGGGCWSGPGCCSGRRSSSGGGPGCCGAAPPCWRARCSGRASSWPSSRGAPTSCVTSSSPGQRSPSRFTGCGRSIGGSGPRPRRPAAHAEPTGSRRGRAYTDARPRRAGRARFTTSQEMDPMGRIGPTEIIIVAVLIIVIFGWKKLPDAARSLGRSARVFKSEVDEMKKDNDTTKSEASTTTVRSEPIEPAAPVTPVDRTVPTTEGNAVHENAPRTDNQPGPVA